MDLLFGPFLRPVPITLMMIPIAIWNLTNSKKVLDTREGSLGFGFLLVAGVAVVFSFFAYPAHVQGWPVWRMNFLFFGMLVLLLFSTNVLRHTAQQHQLDFYRYLEAFLVFNFILLTVYWLDYRAYFQLREFWTLNRGLVKVGAFSVMTRFVGTMSDPNNLSTAIVAVYAFLCTYRSIAVWKFVVYSAMTVVILVGSMSNTGFLAFGIAVTALAFRLTLHNRWRGNSLLFVIGFVIVVLFANYVLSETEVGSVALDRVSSNSVEARLAKIRYLFNGDTLIKLVIGDGGTVIFGGRIFKPHIGPIHFLMNYGGLASLLFFCTIFKLKKGVSIYYYLPLFIIFVGFSSNTGFTDFRFCVLVAVLVAAYHAEHFKTQLSANAKRIAWAKSRRRWERELA